MAPASQYPAGIAFGRFQILPDRREILVDDRPTKLGGRAFDVLMASIEVRGVVVSKDALMAPPWIGDLQTAELRINRLKDHAGSRVLGSYYAAALGFEGQLYAARGDSAAGVRLIRTSLAGLEETEGFETPDLMTAKALLHDLGSEQIAGRA
jgi:hypothetical protein